MTKKRIILLTSLSTTLIILIVYLAFAYQNKSQKINEKEMPEIILGMKLGGNLHEQLKIASNNGMVQNNNVYCYTLDKKSIYPFGSSEIIEAQIFPEFIFDGTDTILVRAKVFYFTKDEGPFTRLIENNKYLIKPINLDSLSYDELLKMDEVGLILKRNYYYLFAHDVDDLMKTLESKYGKLKKVKDYVNISEKKDCNEIVKEGSLVKEFLWSSKNLIIYGKNEPIELTKKNGFTSEVDIYVDLTTFSINYSLPNKRLDELLKMSEKYEWKKKKELQNKGL